MKSSLLLVQEREAKIPALVWEVAAHSAAAPPLPRMSVVLHGKFDSKMSCFAPKVPSDRSHYLTCSPIIRSSALQITATLLATAGENMSFPPPLISACIQNCKNKVILPKEHNLASTKSLLNLSVDVT